LVNVIFPGVARGWWLQTTAVAGLVVALPMSYTGWARAPAVGIRAQIAMSAATIACRRRRGRTAAVGWVRAAVARVMWWYMAAFLGCGADVPRNLGMGANRPPTARQRAAIWRRRVGPHDVGHAVASGIADSPGGLQIELLGPVEAWVDGKPVALGGQRPRALFALLALTGGRVVTNERLIDELWGQDPPARARDSLQMHVSRLRKALTEAGVRCRSAGQTGGRLPAGCAARRSRC
jgi:hypothetical protein